MTFDVAVALGDRNRTNFLNPLCSLLWVHAAAFGNVGQDTTGRVGDLCRLETNLFPKLIEQLGATSVIDQMADILPN